ncbi:MAG: hypothetical protein QM796_15280 [Chthoniobacteraceae bacterium]
MKASSASSKASSATCSRTARSIIPDEVLAQLDYVVASVHAVFNLPEAEMTKRIIKAISNPHVTMLGHLTGRLLLQRESYAVDIPAILDAAAETGTIIELNGNPRRLDMDWRWWSLAKSKGVKCSINPDAHHVSGFQHLWFGVALARKGWLTKADVVNCLPLGKIEKVLAAKKVAQKNECRARAANRGADVAGDVPGCRPARDHAR